MLIEQEQTTTLTLSQLELDTIMDALYYHGKTEDVLKAMQLYEELEDET